MDNYIFQYKTGIFNSLSYGKWDYSNTYWTMYQELLSTAANYFPTKHGDFFKPLEYKNPTPLIAMNCEEMQILFDRDVEMNIYRLGNNDGGGLFAPAVSNQVYLFEGNDDDQYSWNYTGSDGNKIKTGQYLLDVITMKKKYYIDINMEQLAQEYCD